jgi:hypothetical protein
MTNTRRPNIELLAEYLDCTLEEAERINAECEARSELCARVEQQMEQVLHIERLVERIRKPQTKH